MGSTRGNLIVVSAPSGAGKTSLVKAVLAHGDGVRAAVSHTTRAQRQGEIEAEDYYFVDRKHFEGMIEAGEFLEYAEVFGNLYGTSLGPIENTLNTGSDLILEIDWQGARIVRENYPDALSIFILPPSRQTLEERLRRRGQDDDAVIAERMAAAFAELSHHDEYQYLIVNDQFDQALSQFRQIIGAGRLQRNYQQRKFADTIRDLMAS